MPETGEICTAEIELEARRLSPTDVYASTVRCVRPEGHKGPHSGVITWTKAP